MLLLLHAHAHPHTPADALSKWVGYNERQLGNKEAEAERTDLRSRAPGGAGIAPGPATPKERCPSYLADPSGHKCGLHCHFKDQTKKAKKAKGAEDEKKEKKSKDKDTRLDSLVCIGMRLYSVKNIFKADSDDTFEAEFRLFYEWQDQSKGEMRLGMDFKYSGKDKDGNDVKTDIPEVKFPNAVSVETEDMRAPKVCFWVVCAVLVLACPETL